MKRLLTILILLAGCGRPDYSPWEYPVDETGLTQKHLEWLSESDGPFEPFRIAVIADTQMGAQWFQVTVDEINERRDLDFIVIAGDLTDMGFHKEFEWIARVIDSSRIPVLTVVGNHDGLSKGKKIYRKMFGEFNYSFTYKETKFVMWNNNFFEWGDPDFSWLADEVDERTVVVAHQPPGAGTLKQWHEEIWDDIRNDDRMIASVHGHQHTWGFNDDFGTPTWTVDRVVGGHYGTIHFNEDGVVEFYQCTKVCEEVQQ